MATDLLVPGSSSLKFATFVLSWWRGRAGGDGLSCAWGFLLVGFCAPNNGPTISNKPRFFSKEVDCLTDYLLGEKAESGGHGRSFMRVALDVDFFVFSLFISPGGAGALVATDLLVPGTSLCQLLRDLKQWPMKGSKVPSHSFLFSWWRGRAGGDGPSCA